MSIPFKKPAICNTMSRRVGIRIGRKYGIISKKLQKLFTSFLLLWICKRSIQTRGSALSNIYSTKELHKELPKYKISNKFNATCK